MKTTPTYLDVEHIKYLGGMYHLDTLELASNDKGRIQQEISLLGFKIETPQNCDEVRSPLRIRN